jgi:hypothetical protein
MVGDGTNQCCGSGMFHLSRIPDPSFSIQDPGSIQEFKYFNPKKMVSELSEIRSGLFIPDPDPGFYPSLIPDPGVKKAPDPGSGSATLVPIFPKKTRTFS